MFLIPIIVFILAFLFIATVAFSTFRKSKKASSKTTPAIEQRFNEHLRKINEASPVKNMEKVCEYCGSSISDGAKECESCGAKVKK